MEENNTHLKVTRRGFVGAAALTGIAAGLATVGLGSWTGFKAFADDADDESFEEEVIRSACRNCYGRCTINGYVRNGKLVRIEPCEGTYSEGTICSRAYAIPQLMYSPKRIVYPMKQVGDRRKTAQSSS